MEDDRKKENPGSDEIYCLFEAGEITQAGLGGLKYAALRNMYLRLT